MTAKLNAIWRYPIKGIGREVMGSVDVTPDAPLPQDRAWALLHENAEADTDAWQARRNFLVVASGPELARVTLTNNGKTLRLSHPTLPDLAMDPAKNGNDLCDWIKPIWPQDRPAPTRLACAPHKGMGDNGFAQVSILNLASLKALSDHLGQPLEIERFRGNLILEGLSPWEEFNWVGKSLSIGEVTFDVTARVERCRATEASPRSGTRDVNTLQALEAGWGHRDFGIYATITSAGTLRPGDEAKAH